ncbi:MAG: hypothetical protein N4A64_10775 [Marinisporobacter sp.]|jgi:hypothetical protein|nr:hypothetical protein [Marinisporobacter sp.]
MKKFEETYNALKQLSQKQLKEMIKEHESLLIFKNENYKIKLFNIDHKINIVTYTYGKMKRSQTIQNVLNVYLK